MRSGNICVSSWFDIDGELRAEADRLCRATAALEDGQNCETVTAWLVNAQGDAATKLTKLRARTTQGCRAKCVALVSLWLAEPPDGPDGELCRSLCADILRLIPDMEEAAT
jgi:hypothetical protein